MSDKPAPTKRKRAGGRKPALDPEAVAAALAELKGNVSAVASRFKVHRSSVQGLIDRRPTLQKILADAREGMTDNAESSLYRAILAGEGWAVCFYLKTQGWRRGYVERHKHEHAGEGGGPLKAEVKHDLAPYADAARALLDSLAGRAGAPDVHKNGAGQPLHPPPSPQ